MAAPTTRCPFKSNAGIGLTCEASACMGYDAAQECCRLLIVVQQEYRNAVADAKLVKGDINVKQVVS